MCLNKQTKFKVDKRKKFYKQFHRAMHSRYWGQYRSHQANSLKLGKTYKYKRQPWDSLRDDEEKSYPCGFHVWVSKPPKSNYLVTVEVKIGDILATGTNSNDNYVNRKCIVTNSITLIKEVE